jgi:hypothetical protein
MVKGHKHRLAALHLISGLPDPKNLRQHPHPRSLSLREREEKPLALWERGRGEEKAQTPLKASKFPTQLDY